MTTFSIASLCVISEASTTCISVGVAELLYLPAGTLGPLGLQPFGSGPSCWGHNNSSPGSLSIAVYKGPCSCLDKGSCLGWCHCYSYRSSCIHWMTNQLRYNLVVDSALAVLQGTKCDHFHGVVLVKDDSWYNIFNRSERKNEYAFLNVLVHDHCSLIYKKIEHVLLMMVMMMTPLYATDNITKI